MSDKITVGRKDAVGSSGIGADESNLRHCIFGCGFSQSKRSTSIIPPWPA